MSSSDTTRHERALDYAIDLQMSDALARNWWAVALRGLVAILFGIVTFAWPGATMLSLVFIFAAYALVDGICDIVAAVRSMRRQERWGLLILEGIVDILAAAIAVAWPGLTILTFVLVIAAWALITGVLMMVAAFRLNLDHGRWWLVLGGLVSILYGVLLVIAPMVGAVVLTWWLGAYALVFGVLMLILAFRLRAMHETGTHPGAAHAAL